MKTMRLATARALFAFVVVAAAGCGLRAPMPAQLATADYGPAPEDLKPLIQSFLDERLKDPASAKITDIEGPVKGYVLFGDGLTTNGQLVANEWRSNEHYFGWKVCLSYNGKNGFGAYTGFERAGLFVSKGKLRTYYVGNLVESEFCRKNVAEPRRETK